MWSDRVVEPSLEEHGLWVERLEREFTHALDHFGLRLRDDATAGDLASAMASLIEGVWLNQCLTNQHPSNPREPIATVLRRSGRLLWLGAIRP